MHRTSPIDPSPIYVLGVMAIGVLAVMFHQDLQRRFAAHDAALARIQHSTDRLHGVVW